MSKTADTQMIIQVNDYLFENHIYACLFSKFDIQWCPQNVDDSQKTNQKVIENT